MNIEAQIQNVNKAFVEAFSAGDPARLAATYTTNGQALPPGGEVVTGRPAIQAMWQHVLGLGIKAAELQTVELDVMNDVAAVEVGRYRLLGADGAPLDHGKYVVVWRREGDKWHWHRDIWNSSKQ